MVQEVQFMTIKIKSCLGRNFHKKVVESKPSWDDDNIYSYLKLTKPPKPLWQPQWKKPVVNVDRKHGQDYNFDPSWSVLACNIYHAD